MAKYLSSLTKVCKEDVTKAGGKGANLGEMIAADLPVPEGFVLLTNSYKRFIEANNIDKDIEALLLEINHNDYESLSSATEKIKALFEKGKIPEDIKAEIDETYEALGEPTVAIRSSATAEDMPGMSFAGQYSTYLNVKGNEEVYKYIIKCWASLWNDRAVSYRIKQDIGNKDLAHGIVVQRLINAEKSGILFTANPVNGRRDEILINSSWGLGEAIVGGEVTPDQWVINKKTASIVSEEIAQKKAETIRKDKGIELVKVAEERQNKPTLNKTEKMELLKLANKVEDYFGFPQDIEWAFEDGKFYLVQTRPITTLYPVPDQPENEDDFRVYVNMYIYSQSMKEPFTPMGFQIAKFSYTGILQKFGKKNYQGDRLWWLNNLAGRGYADITSYLNNKNILDKLKGQQRNAKDPITNKALIQLIEKNKDKIINKNKKSLSLMSILNFRLMKLLIEGLFKSLYTTINPTKARKIAIDSGDKYIETFKKEIELLRSLDDKLDFVEKNCDAGMLASLNCVLYGGISLTYLDKAEKMLEKYLEDTSDLQHVEKSVPNNVTTEMGMELLQIAKKLSEKGKKASIEDKEVQAFLEKYGDKNSSIELEIACPTWREDPKYILDMINSYIDDKNYDEEIERFYKGKAEAEEAILRMKKKLEQKAGKRTANKVEKILRNYREVFGLREQPKYYMIKVIGIIRQILLEVGEELKNKGRLNEKEDVFFVTVEDIRSNKNLIELVKKNKEEYYRELERPTPPRIITSTGESIYSALEKVGDNAFAGVPVSPGVYEGKVKVLKSPMEGKKLEKGDILVTPATNPSWTPLFLRIGALIMETGGPISHGSVVAREYGVPAVVGVIDATSNLQDGQIVRVNGETGIVELLNEDNEMEK